MVKSAQMIITTLLRKYGGISNACSVLNLNPLKINATFFLDSGLNGLYNLPHWKKSNDYCNCVFVVLYIHLYKYGINTKGKL